MRSRTVDRGRPDCFQNMECSTRLLKCCSLLMVLTVMPARSEKAKITIGVAGKNVAAEVNGTLIVNCTIKSSTCNSSSLHFTAEHQAIPPQYLYILTNETVQLRYPNIPRSFDDKVLRCISDEGNSTPNYIRVLQPPIPVEVDCTLDSWEELECSWTPSYSAQISHCGAECTYQQEIHFKLYRPNADDPFMTGACKSISNCKGKTSYSWSLNKSSTCREEELLVEVVALSHYHEDLRLPASLFTIYNRVNLCSLAVPPPVTGFEASVTESKSSFKSSLSRLSWEEPEVPETSSHKQLYYTLSYRALWGYELLSGEDIVNETSYVFETRPHTTYSVIVNANLVGSRKRGKPRQFNFTTPQERPYVNPCDTPYSFFVDKYDRCSDDSKNVTILCQGVNRKYWNGEDFGSLLQVKSAGEDSWLTRDKRYMSRDRQIVSVSKCVRPPQTLRILSENDAGRSVSDDAPEFFIPMNASVRTDLFAEYDNGTVRIHWHYDEDRVREQRSVVQSSVFWCEAGCSGGKLHQARVDAGQAVFEIQLDKSNFTRYWFGVVPEVEGSPGITWSQKYYVTGEAPVAPTKMAFKIDQHTVTFSIDMPRYRPETGRVTGLIVRFRETQALPESFVERELALAPWSHEPLTGQLKVRAGIEYEVTVHSVTGDNIQSQPWTASVFTTPESWKTTGAIIGLCISVPLVVLLVCCGVWYLIRRMKKVKKKMLNIPIKTPSQTVSADSGMGPDDNGYLSSPSIPINGDESCMTTIPESPIEEVVRQDAEREHLAQSYIKMTASKLTIDASADSHLYKSSHCGDIDIKERLEQNCGYMSMVTQAGPTNPGVLNPFPNINNTNGQNKDKSSGNLASEEGSTNIVPFEMSLLKSQPVTGYISEADLQAMRHVSSRDDPSYWDLHKTEPESGYNMDSPKRARVSPVVCQQGNESPAYISQAECEAMNNRSPDEDPLDTAPTDTQPLAVLTSQACNAPRMSNVPFDERVEESMACGDISSVTFANPDFVLGICTDLNSPERDGCDDKPMGGYITESDLNVLRHMYQVK